MSTELSIIIALSALALYLMLRKPNLPPVFVRPDSPEEIEAKKLLAEWAVNPANPDSPNFNKEAYDKFMAELDAIK